MNARDRPYGVHYLEEPLPEDMQGCFADVAAVRYVPDGALLGVDHIVGPGCSGRVLGFMRTPGDLNFDVELEGVGVALLIWAAGVWIVRPPDKPILTLYPMTGFKRVVAL